MADDYVSFSLFWFSLSLILPRGGSAPEVPPGRMTQKQALVIGAAIIVVVVLVAAVARIAAG